jgi:ribulose-5-phosphate 4-epimerase/fuculose-1-phosphate aldolase
MNALSELKQKIVTACRILDHEGVMDELGHFSARCPENNRILMNGGISPGQVSIQDIILLDLNGKKLEGKLDPPKEIPLHLAVYQKRPEVMAIAHSHPPATIALSIAGAKLRAVDNMGAIVFGSGFVPMYEEYGLVDNFEMGFEIEKVMGPRNIVVLKGHGNMVTGRDIEEVCLFAIWAEKAAHLQYTAMQIGEPAWFPDNVIEKIRNQFIGGKAHAKALSYYQWRLKR